MTEVEPYVPEEDNRDALLEGRVSAIHDTLSTAPRSEDIPSLDNLLRTILDGFGGVDQFASTYCESLKTAKMGSVVHSRMLEKLIDLLKLNEQLHSKDSGKDLRDYSDEELQDVLRGHLKGMGGES